MAAKKPRLVSVEDYLAGELDSPVKHEYLGGMVVVPRKALSARSTTASTL